MGFRCLKYTIGLVNFHSWKMQYIKQEVFARLILHNFCSAVISTISHREQNKTEDVPTEDVSSVSEDKNDCEKKRGIAFTNAVTVCRELLDNNKAAFIKRAIQTIRPHTYEYKVNRTYTRNVKPKSNKPFGYKAS